jgi:myo-inositol-1(or 4)-monophosphatase
MAEETDPIDARLAAGLEMARLGGEVAKAGLHRAAVSIKADRSVVTEADHAVQQCILDGIAKGFPHDAVLAEERIPHPERHSPVGETAYCWVIDPIDGTRNFARGLPYFSLSIGVFRGDEPVVGVVYDPIGDQMYFAAEGRGAFCNDRKLTVLDEVWSEETMLAVPSGPRTPLPPDIKGWLDRAVFRNVGSTALHLALVASGALNGMYADDCKLWDIAAGLVLIREAGGVATSPTGAPLCDRPVGEFKATPLPIAAAGPGFHQELLTTFLENPS